jgi:hypothetical protein
MTTDPVSTPAAVAQVVIVNKRRHKVTIGVYNADGKLVAKHLGPLERTTVPVKSVAPYTLQLAQTKHLDLIKAS